jgi:hypothetical protein
MGWRAREGKHHGVGRDGCGLAGDGVEGAVAAPVRVLPAGASTVAKLSGWAARRTLVSAKNKV